ncbi:MAG: N4-gp56 family major capsid protein [Clostridiales bacterium]|nr:N4-gp56 family major capsid protein [Candidatus Cacconaster stercorequi]
MKIFDLQKFATDINVNTRTGNADPYAGTTTTNSNLTAEDKVFYNTEMLENAKPEYYYQQFAKKIVLPANHGSTVEVRRPNKLPNAQVLTEGVVPDGTEWGVSNITDTLFQYGMYVPVSDLASLHSIDNLGVEITHELGNSMGSTQDTACRDDVVTGTGVMYADKVSGGSVTEITSRATLEGTCKLTSRMVAKASTYLRKTNTPKIDGKYIAIIHPSVAHDLRQDDAWIEAHKYAATTEIFNGEIGELHGVRFVESTNAKVIRGADLASDSRTLAVNKQAGYSGAITEIEFDSGTVEAHALKGKKIVLNGVEALVTDNTAAKLTVESTDFGTVADNDVIYPEGNKTGGAVYCCVFIGKDAYATVDAEGGGCRMIIKTEKEVGGPLEQFGTFGYKGEANGALILYQERMIRLECCSEFSDVDEGN